MKAVNLYPGVKIAHHKAFHTVIPGLIPKCRFLIIAYTYIQYIIQKCSCFLIHLSLLELRYFLCPTAACATFTCSRLRGFVFTDVHFIKGSTNGGDHLVGTKASSLLYCVGECSCNLGNRFCNRHLLKKKEEKSSSSSKNTMKTCNMTILT